MLQASNTRIKFGKLHQRITPLFHRRGVISKKTTFSTLSSRSFTYLHHLGRVRTGFLRGRFPLCSRIKQNPPHEMVYHVSNELAGQPFDIRPPHLTATTPPKRVSLFDTRRFHIKSIKYRKIDYLGENGSYESMSILRTVTTRVSIVLTM